MEKKNGKLLGVAVILGILLFAVIAITVSLKLSSKKIALHPASADKVEVEGDTSATGLETKEVQQSIEGKISVEKSGKKSKDTDEEKSGEYLCDYSADRLITQDDYKELEKKYAETTFPSNRKLAQMLINEMYAKYGYIFKDDELNDYFKEKEWYGDFTTTYTDMKEVTKLMSKIEKKNVDFLKTKL